ncbi:MAG TPA: sigma-70 family RNA polymerase sigma factor [Anaerolineales bacterium]|nr:sigma-70 family RNA polymerase sigma factor [Anaerolineales bacterium]
MSPDQQKARVHSERPVAAEELYREHHEHIFRFIWSRVYDAQQAEDLTGEVFTRMVANLSTYQDLSIPFRAWLYRIARNLIIDHHRKESSAQALTDVVDHPITQSSPEEQAETALTLERVQGALKSIDPEQREVVELRFLGELSLEEVSLVMNKSVPSIKALQHRGLTSLRAYLKELE